jgi:hypothetical protein
MIINEDSCANVASIALVRKLNLSTVKHHKPYRLSWLNECGEVKMTKKVLILFLIGRYSNEELCNMVLIHASHLLLSRPWQFDKKTMYDGFRNKYTIVKYVKSSPLYHYHPNKCMLIILNSSEEHGEKRKSNLGTNELKLNSAKNGGKIRREKKISV